MILEKWFVWEKLCLWIFKISTGMQDANLRSMACIACHSWNGMSAQFGYQGNYDLQIYTKHPSYAVTRPSKYNPFSCYDNACHAPEIFNLYCDLRKALHQINKIPIVKSFSTIFLIDWKIHKINLNWLYKFQRVLWLCFLNTIIFLD